MSNYAKPIPERVIDTLIPNGLLYKDEATLNLLHEFAQNVNNEAYARFPEHVELRILKEQIKEYEEVLQLIFDMEPYPCGANIANDMSYFARKILSKHNVLKLRT